jgi:hypothetical protein
MVKCSVFFAVRTEFLNIIWTSFGFKGLPPIENMCGSEQIQHRPQLTRRVQYVYTKQNVKSVRLEQQISGSNLSRLS